MLRRTFETLWPRGDAVAEARVVDVEQQLGAAGWRLNTSSRASDVGWVAGYLPRGVLLPYCRVLVFDDIFAGQDALPGAPLSSCAHVVISSDALIYNFKQLARSAHCEARSDAEGILIREIAEDLVSVLLAGALSRGKGGIRVG